MSREQCKRFVNGDLVDAILFEGESRFTIGEEGVTEIICVMENGQMEGVPWFEVWKGDKLASKWNGALLRGVGY